MLKKLQSNRNIVLIVINMMAAMVFFTPYMRFSYYDQMIEALNLSNQAFGTLATAYGLVALIGYLVSGVLADMFKPRILLSISVFGMGLCTVWHATFPNYTILLLIYALFAIFSVVTFWSPYLKCIRSLGSEEEQGRLFGRSEAFRGVMATIVAFGCLAILSQFIDGVAGFRVLLYVNAVIFFILGILALLLIPEVKKEEQSEKFSWKKFKNALINPGVWMITIVVFCGYGLATYGANYLATYTTQMLGLSEELASSLSIIRIYVLCIIGGFLGGILADKCKTRSFFISLLFIIAVITIVLIMITSDFMASFAIVLTFVLSFCYYTIKSLYFSTLGEAGIPFALTGIGTGIISFIGLSPDVFVTPMVGSWLDINPASGFNKMFLCMIITGIIGIIMTLIIHRKFIRTENINKKK